MMTLWGRWVCDALVLCVPVDLLQRTRVTPSRTKGLTSDLSQVGGSASRVQDMLATVLTYIEDVLVSTLERERVHRSR